MIVTITEKKSSATVAIIWKPLSSDRVVSLAAVFRVITATTIAEIYFSSFSATVAIIAIVWKPLSSDRSDSKNTRMHCVSVGKILLEGLSNPKSMGLCLSPISRKKTSYKQELTIHSRYVEFEFECSSFPFSAIIWKPSIAQLFFSATTAIASIMAIVAIIWKPALTRTPT